MNTPDQDMANKLVTLYQLIGNLGEVLTAEQKQMIADECMSIVFEDKGPGFTVAQLVPKMEKV